MRVYFLAVSVLLVVFVVQYTPAQADMILDIENCPCFLIITPVCGSDNKSYDNECHLNCNAKHSIGLHKVKDGACNSEPSMQPREVPR
uniref:Kazal-like domain-containing protein n=2 Tax=gambiae species complex TaxID=44542 RepID=A0A2Y9D2G9_ANOGA